MRGRIDHGGTPLACRGGKFADELRFGQVGPVSAWHFFLHHFQLEARGVENVLVVGQPKRFSCISGGNILLHGARSEPDGRAVPGDTPLGCQDGPAHLREAAGEKRRDGFNNVMFGLEPGHVQGPVHWTALESVVLKGAKAHKRFHLVHVAPHRLRHLRGLDAVGVKWVVAQAWLVRVAPKQAVQKPKALRVAVQNDVLAQQQKVGRHTHTRTGYVIRCTRVILEFRWWLTGKQICSNGICTMPADFCWLGLLCQQAPCMLPKPGQVGGVGQGDGFVTGGRFTLDAVVVVEQIVFCVHPLATVKTVRPVMARVEPGAPDVRTPAYCPGGDLEAARMA